MGDALERGEARLPRRYWPRPLKFLRSLSLLLVGTAAFVLLFDWPDTATDWLIWSGSSLLACSVVFLMLFPLSTVSVSKAGIANALFPIVEWHQISSIRPDAFLGGIVCRTSDSGFAMIPSSVASNAEFRAQVRTLAPPDSALAKFLASGAPR